MWTRHGSDSASQVLSLRVLSLESATTAASPGSTERDCGRPKTPRRPGTSSGRSKQTKATEFRSFLESGELPLRIESTLPGLSHGGRRVVWTCNLDQLDLSHFLPLCLGGIQESQEPYSSFAFDASMQLLESGMHDARVLKCIAQVVGQIKGALGTREKEVVHRALLLLQQLTVCDGVGEALGDHYRAILPLCNILQDKHLGTGDELTHDLVAETLETMESYGRDDAQVLIRQYVPTFSSQFPSDRLVST